MIGDKSIAYPAMDITLRADGTLLELHVSNIIDNPVAADPEAKPLSLEQMLDENVLLKLDYFMPTLSFKDRGAAVLKLRSNLI